MRISPKKRPVTVKSIRAKYRAKHPEVVKTWEQQSGKFIQIMSTKSPARNSEATWLLALDDNGVVCIYLGFKIGWKPLNMKRMSAKQAEADNQAFVRGRQQPIDWNDEDLDELRWDR